MDFVMRPNIKVKSLVEMLISLINDVERIDGFDYDEKRRNFVADAHGPLVRAGAQRQTVQE